MTSAELPGLDRRYFVRGLVLAGLLLAPAIPAAQLALGPARAQEQNAAPRFSTLRAVNLARMRAESLNGGLIVYRPQRCMYEDNGGACLVSSNANGIVFRFFGGPPGWQEQNQPPTVESEILISADGRQVLDVLYNGKPRSAT
jgi:hypothetical protein